MRCLELQHKDAFLLCMWLMWLLWLLWQALLRAAAPAQHGGAGRGPGDVRAPRPGASAQRRCVSRPHTCAAMATSACVAACSILPSFRSYVHGPPQITVGACSAMLMLCLAQLELQQSSGVTSVGSILHVPHVAQSCASLTWHACLRRTQSQLPAWPLMWRLSWGGLTTRWLLGRS